MPTDTNGVHFFTPAADHDDEDAAATSPGSESAHVNALDNIRDYGMKHVSEKKTIEKPVITEQAVKVEETTQPFKEPTSPVFHVNLGKINSTETIVGPNTAMKARSFNMTEVDFSIAGISSTFAPVPYVNIESSSANNQVPEMKASQEAALEKSSPTQRKTDLPPDSPSPKRKVKKVKSVDDSEPPKGYFEAKQKERNERRRSNSQSPPREPTGSKEKETKKTVDSELFDSGPFKKNYAMGHSDHSTASPFEISTCPIEVNESRNHKAIEISNREKSAASPVGSGTLKPSETGPEKKAGPVSEPQKSHRPTLTDVDMGLAKNGSTSVVGNEFWSPQNSDKEGPKRKEKRARLESQNEGCLSPSSLKSVLDEIQLEPRCKSPQQIDLHTFRDAVDVNYQRMAITGEELSGVPLEDLKTASGHLIEALQLRSRYMERIGNQFPSTTRNFLSGHYPNNLPKHRVKNTETTNCLLHPPSVPDLEAVQTSFNPPDPPKDHWGKNDPLPKYDIVYQLKRNRGVTELLLPDGTIDEQFKSIYVTKEEFLNDTEKLTAMIVDGPLKSFCFRRLSYLENKFQLHVLLNELRELHEQKGVSHRDFYNIRKVDTHIHAASSMNQKHLLRFIKKKIKTEADSVVLEKDGVKVTMKEVFKKMGIDAYDLSVDMLDVHADRNTFHRFDKFNTKYNPVGESTLREIFIKTDNYVGGKYFADLLKETLSDLEDSKYQHSEPRLSIYGRSKIEWDNLAKWALTHDVWSPNARWLIQIPRLYDVYRAKNMVKNFDDMLDNLFTPLFEVTNDPSSHPELHLFLKQVSGIDSVDDESKHEFVHFDRSTPCPPEYTDLENPPYNYYLFYMYANICALNAFRRARGLNTFALRPHCGEAGHVSHLLTGYLTSESIAHGILLRKVPVLQYLFYLTQMGIAMSPLSNNSLFISYQRNPLPEYLQKGLNVSLSTDDPLQFHYTKEALMEEYSIAAQVWKLSSCDMCELARNSVMQSGFEDKVKIHWLGPNYKEEGVLGNDIHRTNVPDIRVSFRHEALVDELYNLFRVQSTIKQ